MRKDWVKSRTGNVTQMHHARKGVITEEMQHVARLEHLEPEFVVWEIAEGRLISPANIHHTNLEPMGIGIAARCKVNANIGNSSLSSSEEEELAKLNICIKHGVDAVMDLSTGKNIHELTIDDLLDVIEIQARQGVDFMTIHCGLLHEFLPLAAKRTMGIVSRGGAIMAQWMAYHNRQNPLDTHFD